MPWQGYPVNGKLGLNAEKPHNTPPFSSLLRAPEHSITEIDGRVFECWTLQAETGSGCVRVGRPTPRHTGDLHPRIATREERIRTCGIAGSQLTIEQQWNDRLEHNSRFEPGQGPEDQV